LGSVHELYFEGAMKYLEYTLKWMESGDE
jgi:hypothetical protein